MKVLVTGASAGFGEAIGRLFVAQGHEVVGTGRRAEKLQALKAELGDRFIPLAFDLTSLEQTQAALAQVADFLEQLDVLVNNAGLALGLLPAHQADLTDWQQMIQTNVVGLCQITSLILPIMVKNNHGLVINMGSIAGNYPYAGSNVYGATKAFVRQFSLNLRADLADTRVRVSNVEPGLCGGTEFSNVRFHGDDQKAAAVYEGVDYVTPEDIANIVLWIANQPEHVNINSLEVMPTAQTFAGLKVSRAN